MGATFRVHLDIGDDGIIWWAECDMLTGVSIAADSYPDLRRLAEEAVAIHCAEGTEISFELDPHTDESLPDLADVVPLQPEVVGTSAPRTVTRQVLVPVA